MSDYTARNLANCIDGHRAADRDFLHIQHEINDLIKQGLEYIIKLDDAPSETFERACLRTPTRSAAVRLENDDLVFGEFAQFFLLFRGGRMIGLADAKDYAKQETRWFPVTQFTVMKSEQVA